ncbi:DUF3846 domain-containing protein [Arthrobacter sp. YN]|uniref:DUF3846 domain-containing protein n=1 Tax=Arthrobacter sp. YN TaxID=2020486 RepID=UPI000B60C352|nr:hypothetical protein [Arthrobacter sp. YN]ASN20264.1 hypothetical protein CGK93_11750 [Arthrobacter sp. YN]
MKQKVLALIVPARISSPIGLEWIGYGLDLRQKLVKGNVGTINGRGWHVFLNDEAEFIPLPLNPRAEVLIREAGLQVEDTISGDAIFLGHASNGEDTCVPEHLLTMAERLFETRLAA